MAATRKDVKSVLDQLAARLINVTQARAALAAIGLTIPDGSPAHPLQDFCSGARSYADVYQFFGV